MICVFDILIQTGRNIPNQRRMFAAVYTVKSLYRYLCSFVFVLWLTYYSELKSRISIGKEPFFSLQYEKILTYFNNKVEKIKYYDMLGYFFIFLF